MLHKNSIKNYESHIAKKGFIQSKEISYHVTAIRIDFDFDIKDHVMNSNEMKYERVCKKYHQNYILTQI